MRIHFIAIGGAVMHNLALALQKRGDQVSGSDDEIFDPARGRLAEAGLLPDRFGWDPLQITTDLDSVILGMHARADNPELIRARELSLPVYSFPEFIYLETRTKRRIVIAGSHGKTTVTSLIMHVLRSCSLRFDYLVGAQIDGFATMVGLDDQAELAVFEGDEYLSSALDRRPKFLHYRPQLAVINGIAWDHINVFPTFDLYRAQFQALVEAIESDGKLLFNREDPEVCSVVESASPQLALRAYAEPSYRVKEGRFHLLTSGGPVPVQLLGRHNMLNIEAARTVCDELGIPDSDFYGAVAGYRGASRRLTPLRESESSAVYLDFAHAPSKVRATVQALREAFPNRTLVACLELHTFSSLNADFLVHYRGSLDAADVPMVYFDPRTVEHKRLAPLDPGAVAMAFGSPGLRILTSASEVEAHLRSLQWRGTNLLLMSSGSFSGLDLEGLARDLLGGVRNPDSEFGREY